MANFRTVQNDWDFSGSSQGPERKAVSSSASQEDTMTDIPTIPPIAISAPTCSDQAFRCSESAHRLPPYPFCSAMHSRWPTWTPTSVTIARRGSSRTTIWKAEIPTGDLQILTERFGAGFQSARDICLGSFEPTAGPAGSAIPPQAEMFTAPGSRAHRSATVGTSSKDAHMPNKRQSHNSRMGLNSTLDDALANGQLTVFARDKAASRTDEPT